MSTSLPPTLSALLSATDPAAQEEAWTAFVREHSRLILHTARSLGGDYDVAMNRYSYVLEQLLADDCRRLRAYAADGRSKFTTWLVVVTRRLCLDEHRRTYGRARSETQSDAALDVQRRNRKQLVDLVGEQIDASQLEDERSGDPVDALYVSERREILESALEELEPRDRLILRLRFEDDLPAIEIARVVGLPTPFHIYRRLTALFQLLRRSLERRGISDPVP